ncbi:MAG: hypothetical protein NTW16_12610 [Bacteroidetes bacterium]|nr:hypothetical protein [Bacteroidota bacterium]
MKTKLILSAVVLSISALTLFAQAPPPPPASANESGTGPVGGSGAPIGGGLAVALVMVAGFGTWKLLKTFRQKRFSD